MKNEATNPSSLADLVNQLAQELAQSRRELAAATRKLGTTSRSLEGRTQELTEAKSALALLLATLDSTSDGIVAMGYFGRAMHFNSRFIEIWRIPEDKLATLNDAALLTMQLSQVKDPERFLQIAEHRKANADSTHFELVELADGRVLECHVMPQRVHGKRVGTVTSFHDVTERERLARLISRLEVELPDVVAEAKVSCY